MDNISVKSSGYSQAQVIGVLADGYRLLLICNHLLDNTAQPQVEDFSVSCDGEDLPVKASFLASPMLQNSSWAAITLMLNRMVPKSSCLTAEYKQSRHVGLFSLVDKKRLAPIHVSAWCNQSGSLTLQDGDSVGDVMPVVKDSAMNLAPLNVLRSRLDVADANKVQEELFCEYVDSLFDDVLPVSNAVEAEKTAEIEEPEAIPTLTLVAPNAKRPLPVKLTRVEDNKPAKKSERASGDVDREIGADERKLREKQDGLLQSLLNSTTGLMMGRGALIRSK